MKSVKANIWKILLAVLILIPVLLVLTWNLQDIARRLVVVPGSYVIWLFGRLLESTPQFFIWIALITVMGILIGRSLSTRTPSYQEPSFRETGPARRSRLRFWINQLNQRSEFSRSRLAEFVDRLILDVLTYTYHQSTWQVEKRLIDGDIPAPDELVEFLKIRKQLPGLQASRPQEIISDLFFFLKNRFSKKPAGTVKHQLNQELEIILDYLEDQLEIHQ
jgi:hypothetical protein